MTEGTVGAGRAAVVQKPTPAELLLEQYKLLEDRRKYFGSQFMQTIGAAGTLLSFLVGMFFGKPGSLNVLRSVLIGGGIAVTLLAFLGFRLGVRQDDCEGIMRKIECNLRKMEYQVEEMPGGAKIFSARRALVFAMLLLGPILAVLGFLLR